MGKGGKASEPSTPHGQAAEDVPNLSEFIQEDFSAAKYASRALEQSTAAAQMHIAQLEQSIRKLKEKLSAEVVKRQDEFLDQASSMRSAEEAVQSISSSVETLTVSLRRVGDEISEPYREIQLKSQQLKNLQAGTGLLRQILQSVKVTQRLKALMKPDDQGERPLTVLDLGKAAKLLTEAAAVNQEPLLAKIQTVQAEAKFLDQTRSSVTQQAQELLEKGMASSSQAEVGGTLQVFFNLDQLPQAVTALIDGHLMALERSLNSALDPKKLAGEASSTAASSRSTAASARVQEILWQRLGDFMVSLHKSAIAVWHLQRVLAKKNDPLSHVLFLDAYLAVSDAPPLQIFWPRVSRIMKLALDGAISPSKGAVTRETLVHNFSTLANLLETFFKKLHQETNVRGVEGALDSVSEAQLLEALNGCQNLYLGAVFGRVSDAITAAFPGGNRALPTSAELQKCIGRMHEELKNVGDSPRLAAVTTQIIGKALRTLAEKAEFMALAGSEVRNVTGICTTQQMRKIMLCNHLQEVSRSVAAFLPRLPAPAAQNLRAPIEVLEAGALEAVMPLIRAILDRGETILLRVHDEPFGQSESPSVSQSSAFITEFGRHLAHCRAEFLSKLSPPANPQNSTTVGAALVQRLASRFIVFFVRHLSLLRPMTEARKLQLAKDIGDFEEAVSANLWPIDKLPNPQKILRAFRKLIFLETAAIESSKPVTELPLLLVLQHLYSRLPDSVKSPHAASDLTPQQFSLWLDEHSGNEAVAFVKTNFAGCSMPDSASQDQTAHALIKKLLENAS